MGAANHFLTEGLVSSGRTVPTGKKPLSVNYQFVQILITVLLAAVFYFLKNIHGNNKNRILA